MQAVNQEQAVTQTTTAPTVRWLSLEVIAYALLIVAALALRLGELSTTPMTDAEAIQALPAWHVIEPDAPGTPQDATSPLVFWLQLTTFSLLGGTELAARLPGVLGGTLLMLMPLLFRSRIGADRAFYASVLLGIAPIPLVASRTADPAVWVAVFALLLLWAVWRYWQTLSHTSGILVGVALGALVFLADSGGVVLALILAGAGAGTLWWTLLAAPDERDDTGEALLQQVKHALRRFPRVRAFAVLVALVLVTGTGFMLYPAGLSVVGNMLEQTFAGITQPADPLAPVAFPLLALIVYNPLLIVVAALGAGLALTRRPHISERFAIVWVLVAAPVLLLYRGATAADALWIVLPLIYLTTRTLHLALKNYVIPFFGYYDWYPDDDDPDNYWWLKWVIAAATVTLLLMLVVHVGEIGRDLAQLPPEWSPAVLLEARFNALRYSSIWVLITLMLGVVVYLMATSLWGNRTVLQGFALGVIGFMLGAGVATGWNTAVHNVTQPGELWHTQAISPDAYTLRDTLLEVAQRDTMGFPLLPLTIVRDEAAGVRDDALVAWLARDFTEARFVATAAEARQDEIILLAQTDDESEPDLGGSYVGQSFELRRTWTLDRLRGADWLAWWLQRDISPEALPSDVTVLWLRLDLYDGVPANERQLP